jgi:hypothetical protein
MSFLLRSAALFVLCSAATLLSLPGCSEQGEGERCDSAKNGNNDCDSGLICVPAAELRVQTADRCCPADLVSTDSRCDRNTGNAGTGGTGGSGAGTGGTGAASASGGMSGAGGENLAGSSDAGGDTSSAGAPSSPAGGSSGGAG